MIQHYKGQHYTEHTARTMIMIGFGWIPLVMRVDD